MHDQDGDWHNQPFLNDSAVKVWDRVALARPEVVGQITGPQFDASISLEVVVAAFYDADEAGPFGLFPELLTAVLLHASPEGWWSRHDPAQLIQDVQAAWTARRQAKIDAGLARRATLAEIEGGYRRGTRRDPRRLAPMPWVASPHLLRGELFLLHGPGGVGKSLAVLAYAVALALGARFGAFHPRSRSRVVLFAFEDALVLERRIIAMAEWFGAESRDLDDWLITYDAAAGMDPTWFSVDERGSIVATDMWELAEKACAFDRPDVVMVDNFVSVNAASENNAILVRRVISMMLGLAKRLKFALCLVHHDSKAAVDEESDANSARGSGDIINSARSEAAVRHMTAKQAEEWGIDEDSRRFYFRIGSILSKRNYSGPDDGQWVERQEVVIEGEATARIVPWIPPQSKPSLDTLLSALAGVSRGLPNNLGPYSAKLDQNERSIARLLEHLGAENPAMQRAIVKELLARHGVERCDYLASKDRRRQGLRTKDGEPHNYKWCNGEGDPL